MIFYDYILKKSIIKIINNDILQANLNFDVKKYLKKLRNYYCHVMYFTSTLVSIYEFFLTTTK